MKRSGPLKRSAKAIQRKAWMPRISKTRLIELREYTHLRRIFLTDHPVCQVWLSEHGFTEMDLTRDQAGEWAVRIAVPDLTQRISSGCRPPIKEIRFLPAPLSEEVHHKNKRRKAMLLRQEFWMAVSTRAHRWIELHKDEARKRGYLLNF